MKLALVHDWLLERGGAERVLLRLHALWPEAPIYTLAADRAFVKKWLPDAVIRQAWTGRLPMVRRYLSALAPILPAAVESLDLSGFDVVLSSSVAFSKGVVTRARTRHICYCYSPSRYLWDRNAEYERRGPLSRLVRHWLRLWDTQAARRPDAMVAISETVRTRIAKYYGRDATVIHPPLLSEISDSMSPVTDESQGYYLAVGRLIPHKRFHLLIEAFNKLKRPLVIVGSGPMEHALRRAASPIVRIITAADDAELARWYAKCRAVILPNEEDFGMTVIEAMAHGKPVLALRAGGALETVREGETGEFFDDPIPEALAEGVLRLERGLYNSAAIRRLARDFSADLFDARFRALVGN